MLTGRKRQSLRGAATQYDSMVVYCLFQPSHFGISSFSHPDNALEVCGFLTPLHIVPEWYFLCQYAMLKAVKRLIVISLILSSFTFSFHSSSLLSW